MWKSLLESFWESFSQKGALEKDVLSFGLWKSVFEDVIPGAIVTIHSYEESSRQTEPQSRKMERRWILDSIVGPVNYPNSLVSVVLVIGLNKLTTVGASLDCFLLLVSRHPDILHRADGSCIALGGIILCLLTLH